jgi:hypothetical protein
MPKINAELERALRKTPEAMFDLIVRSEEDVTPHLKWLSAEGIKVKRQFRLTPGVAVSCSGQDALRLAAASWVVSVELDAPITTMGR